MYAVIMERIVTMWAANQENERGTKRRWASQIAGMSKEGWRIGRRGEGFRLPVGVEL